MDEQFVGLSKKERRKLKTQLKLAEKLKFERKAKLGNYLVIGTIILVLGGLVFWFVKNETALKPGQVLPDIGRQHVTPGSVVEYNSNPPSSGSHSAEWIKGGLYTKPEEDGKLIHSLEHGYIIISYNCDFEPKKDEKECQELVAQLEKFGKSKNWRKIIVVPRPNLDSRIAVTAWTHLDKFNDFDETRINSFIKAYYDRGPEKTME